VEKSILVPLDGSSISEGALPYAEAVARSTSASLRLLTALEDEPDELLARLNGADYLARVRAAESDYLDRTAETLRQRVVSVSTVLAPGNAVDAILQEATKCEDVMIVMATHGRSGVERWLIGSVADKVMRMTDRPILLVLPSEIAQRRERIELACLMVPLDGSPLAEAALPIAADLATKANAHVQLVQSLPALATTMPYGYAPEIGEDWEERTKFAQTYLAEVRQRLPAALEVETIVLRGGTTETLVDYARNREVDLVVMSTHGRGGFRRLVLGSVADRFVRSGVPTLLVRPNAVEAAAKSQPAEPVLSTAGTSPVEQQ